MSNVQFSFVTTSSFSFACRWRQVTPELSKKTSGYSRVAQVMKIRGFAFQEGRDRIILKSCHPLAGFSSNRPSPIFPTTNNKPPGKKTQNTFLDLEMLWNLEKKRKEIDNRYSESVSDKSVSFQWKNKNDSYSGETKQEERLIEPKVKKRWPGKSTQIRL